MYSRLKKFWHLGRGNQWLLVRIWLMLAAAHLQLRRVGLAHFTSSLTLYSVAPSGAGICIEQLTGARQLSELVSITARWTPWPSTCLLQVLVLQRLLAQRNIPGYFSLGVRKYAAEQASALGAHAWLHCGNAVISGATTQHEYTTLTTFGWGTLVED